MIKIAHFDNVLEVAFGLNALFYIFELIPYTEDRIGELQKRNEILFEKKVSLTKNFEAFPIAFLVGATYPIYKHIFVRVSVVMSFALMGFMVYSSFNPDAQMSRWVMFVLLILAFGIPLVAFLAHRSTIGWIEAANRLLQKEIEKAERDQVPFAMNIGEHQTYIGPGSNEVTSALSRLTTDTSVSFINLSKGDKTAFLKVTGRRKTGFTIEYQEDALHHYKSKATCGKEDATEILLLYLNGSSEWKDMADWDCLEK